MTMRTFAFFAFLVTMATAQRQRFKPRSSKNIVQLAVGTKDLSTLVTALKAGQLVSALEGKGPFTVFAPTNAAFAKLPKATLNSLLKYKNIKTLQAVLEYHVVSGAIYSKSLKSENTVKTLESETMLVEVKNGGVTINHAAHVTTADVAASNGVVHIIDAVLMPPSMTRQSIVELAAGNKDLSTLVTALTSRQAGDCSGGQRPFHSVRPDQRGVRQTPQGDIEQSVGAEKHQAVGCRARVPRGGRSRCVQQKPQVFATCQDASRLNNFGAKALGSCIHQRQVQGDYRRR